MQTTWQFGYEFYRVRSLLTPSMAQHPIRLKLPLRAGGQQEGCQRIASIAVGHSAGPWMKPLSHAELLMVSAPPARKPTPAMVSKPVKDVC